MYFPPLSAFLWVRHLFFKCKRCSRKHGLHKAGGAETGMDHYHLEFFRSTNDLSEPSHCAVSVGQDKLKVFSARITSKACLVSRQSLCPRGPHTRYSLVHHDLYKLKRTRNILAGVSRLFERVAVQGSASFAQGFQTRFSLTLRTRLRLHLF